MWTLPLSARPWTKFYPEGVPASLEYPEESLALPLLRAAREHPERTAMVYFNREISYGQLLDEVQRMAGALQSLGVRPGDRVGIMLPNTPQTVVAYYAVLWLGAVVVMVNPLYTPREMEILLKDSGATHLIALDVRFRDIEQVRPRTQLKHVIVTGIGDYMPAPLRWLFPIVKRDLVGKIPPGADVQRWADMLRHHPVPEPAAVDAKEDLAVLQYTGGTTGVAKGAMLTHGNLLSNLAQSLTVAGDVNRPGEEVVLTALPLYHIFAFTYNLLSFFQIGGHNILIPSPRPVSNLKPAFEKFQITRASGVNVLFAGLLREEWFRTNPPRHLEITISGGTALHSAIAEEWQKVVGGKILEGYGLSETSPTLAVNPIKGENRIGTIGIPMPSTEIRIVDEQGNPVPPGQPGELVARGPQVFKGYWNRPEETEAAMRDGWFHTGDIAIMDERGYLRIVDRKKDLIDVSGFNVYPNEVEDCIARIPAVAEVAVIGVPLPEGGERVRAYVVSTDPNLTEEDVIKHCRQHLTAYKVPKEVIFREELPKTPVGKVLRKDLRAEVLREIGKT